MSVGLLSDLVEDPAFLAAPGVLRRALFGVVGASAFAALLRYGWAPLALAVAIWGGGFGGPKPAAGRSVGARVRVVGTHTSGLPVILA